MRRSSPAGTAASRSGRGDSGAQPLFGQASSSTSPLRSIPRAQALDIRPNILPERFARLPRMSYSAAKARTYSKTSFPVRSCLETTPPRYGRELCAGPDQSSLQASLRQPGPLSSNPARTLLRRLPAGPTGGSTPSGTGPPTGPAWTGRHWPASGSGPPTPAWTACWCGWTHRVMTRFTQGYKVMMTKKLSQNRPGRLQWAS